MTFPKALRDKLILVASFRRSPVAPVPAQCDWYMHIYYLRALGGNLGGGGDPSAPPLHITNNVIDVIMLGAVAWNVCHCNLTVCTMLQLLLHELALRWWVPAQVCKILLRAAGACTVQ